MARQLYLAAYDIADVKRMARARERIRAYSTGGQKSVFECLLTGAESRALIAEMRLLLDSGEDSFLLFPMDPRARVDLMGRARRAETGACLYHG